MSNPVLYDQVMSVLPGALREWLDGESVPVSVAVVLRSSLLNQHLELFLTSGASRELLKRLGGAAKA
jgi:hypothetical protein